MGTLVLKPKAVYTAYLGAYVGAPPGSAMDLGKLENLDPSELQLLAAFALGTHDRLAGDEPQTLRSVLASLDQLLDDEEPEQPLAAPPDPIAAAVDAVALGSWATAENVEIVVLSKIAVPLDQRERLRALCEVRAFKHNANLESK